MAHLEVYWVVAGLHWKPCISWCGFLFFCFCCIFCCKFHVGGVKQLLYADSKCLVSLSAHNTQHLCLGSLCGFRRLVQFHSPTLPVEIWHFKKQTTRYKSQNAKLGSTKARKHILVADGMVLLLHGISSGKREFVNHNSPKITTGYSRKLEVGLKHWLIHRDWYRILDY